MFSLFMCQSLIDFYKVESLGFSLHCWSPTSWIGFYDWNAMLNFNSKYITMVTNVPSQRDTRLIKVTKLHNLKSILHVSIRAFPNQFQWTLAICLSCWLWDQLQKSCICLSDSYVGFTHLDYQQNIAQIFVSLQSLSVWSFPVSRAVRCWLK